MRKSQILITILTLFALVTYAFVITKFNIISITGITSGLEIAYILGTGLSALGIEAIYIKIYIFFNKRK